MESTHGGETASRTDASRLHGHPRDGQDDYWLNIGLAFPHKDGSGFNIMLQALPLDGKIVCREISRGRSRRRSAAAVAR